jgi:hypothetical protein
MASSVICAALIMWQRTTTIEAVRSAAISLHGE